MCAEVLNGIKVIKLYAWEPPMEEVVTKIRDQELALIKKSALARSVADLLNTASPFMVFRVDQTLLHFSGRDTHLCHLHVVKF